MKYIIEFFSNSILMAVLLSWFTAQALKVVFVLITNRKFDLQRFVGSGGMPSSHSSLVMTLVVMVARADGISSTTFALALAFAVIVMYDAMGVRRAAGEQAKVLNKIVFQWGDVVKKDSPEKESSKKADSSEELAKKELKEFLGHTPLEVLGGALLGILIAMFFPVM